MSFRREANQKMTRPVFEANLRRLFPDLEALPHQDTLARLLARIRGAWPNTSGIWECGG